MTRRFSRDHSLRPSCIKLLREEMRIRQFHRVEFLSRANIEQVNLFASGETVCEFARLDLHRAIGLVAGKDVFYHFIDVQIFISRANAGQRFVRD